MRAKRGSGPPQEEDHNFSAFYVENFRTVARYALAMTGSPEEAFDIAQESFARAWAKGSALPQRSPLSYVLTIAHHLAVSRFRRLARERRYAADVQVRSDHDDAESVEQLLDALRLLSTLPARQRSAVVLCDILEMSADDAARILRVSPSTVRVHLSRAHGSLRRSLSLHVSEET